MSTDRTIYLVMYRQSPSQRARFAIWVPYSEGNLYGTIIHVVGAPMAGYQLQFKRKYSPHLTQRAHSLLPIGQTNPQHVHTWTGERCEDDTPRGDFEHIASQIPPPPASKNFLAPVNDTTNRRCQEWIMEFVGRLVEKGYVGPDAAEVVQSQRDPPGHGIGLVARPSTES